MGRGATWVNRDNFVVIIIVYKFSNKERVLLYATPNPFLWNEICLNRI